MSAADGRPVGNLDFTASNPSHSVYVVDDDPVTRQLLSAVLGSGGYRVGAAPPDGIQPAHLAEAGADERMSLRTVLPGA